MTVSDKAGKELSKLTYTYDLAGNKLTSTEEVEGKESKTTFTYDDNNRLTKLENKDGTTTYTYDKNGNRISSKKNDEKLDYIYDTENRLLAVKDKEGLLMAALYDGDDNRVFTASRKEGKYTYQLFKKQVKSPHTAPGGEEHSLFWYGFSQNVLQSLSALPQTVGTIWHDIYDDVSVAYHKKVAKDRANSEGLVANPPSLGNLPGEGDVGKDGTTTYTYDKNGNRISSKKNDEKLDYIYDTENRLLAVKDKEGLLMAALYDGDDNRVFTASRKEGKHTYQLFKKQVKSPHTAPGGEEHSLFWYGFSQNVLQALSALPQTIGTIWHDIYDDVSVAYHKKVAKDRANSEGLVANPPSLGNLPGEGDVTYASQVKDVLIPYTTREDSFNYYEERNYVNDVNREHTEVLQTYDRELKARETYTYGNGRASYLNNETGDHYQYLTNQAGSVTGLTQDGNSVGSSSYTLYG